MPSGVDLGAAGPSARLPLRRTAYARVAEVQALIRERGGRRPMSAPSLSRASPTDSVWGSPSVDCDSADRYESPLTAICLGFGLAA